MDREENREENLSESYFVDIYYWASKNVWTELRSFEWNASFNRLFCSDGCLRLMQFLEPFQSQTSHEGD